MRSSEFKLEIGCKIIDDERDMIITDREYRKRSDTRGYYKYYKYTCNKCGWTEGWIKESNLVGVNKKSRCSCCCNPPKTVVPEINSIWAREPWMIELGVSEEDAKRYTPQSNKKVKVICPYCKEAKEITPDRLYKTKSISCNCGDGFSYPEKFMFNILKQLNVKFKTQYTPDYLNRKFSDFYLPEHNLVIETDGALGHKGGKVHSRSDKTLEELVEVDRWKDKQHKLHGIDTIRIDCFESNMEYIKSSILESRISEIFELEQIDWKQVDIYSIKNNKVKEVCDYWNNANNIKEIADVFDCDTTTVRNYLKRGNKMGWCNYCPIVKRQVEVFKDG